MAVELGKAITCKSFIGCDYSIPGGCTCDDEGPTATTFNIDEYVISYTRFDGEIFIGDVMKHEWWFNGELKWTWEKTATQNYANFWCGWTWWDIGQSHGPGTGHIKIYHNGNLLGQTNDFTLGAPPPDWKQHIPLIGSGIAAAVVVAAYAIPKLKKS